MAAGRVVSKEFREDSAAAASAAANMSMSGSGGAANPLAAAASQGGSLTAAVRGTKISADALHLPGGQTIYLLPENAHQTLYGGRDGRTHSRHIDVERVPLMPVPRGYGEPDDVHLPPDTLVRQTILAGAMPGRAAAASSSASASSGSAMSAAGAGVDALPAIRDPFQYVQRRGVPPKKDRTWGGDVMYYPGVSYLYGLGGGCVYGLVTVPATVGLPLKLRFNSWINAMGRHGSRMANGFGCTAVFYATYKHLVQAVRPGSPIDQWNSIAGAGLAVSTFFVPKGKTYMAAGGVAAATAMAAVEFGLAHPTVQQYQRRTYNAWKRTGVYKALFGDK